MATEPIKNADDIHKLVQFWYDLKNWRNYLLIMVGLNTALRISDILKLQWGDVYDCDRRRVRAHVHLREGKTGKAQCVKINNVLREALVIYRDLVAPQVGDFLFVGKKRGCNDGTKAISRQQAHRIIKEATEKSRINQRVSCHTLRKTFGYQAWRNGEHVAVLMEIYNHSSYEVTRRYLGIGQDERDGVHDRVQLR